MTDEEKISRLYQQGNKQEPPVQLDETILAMARTAVQDDAKLLDEESQEVNLKNKIVKVKSPFSGGWPATASIAAVLVITVILVPLLQQEESSPTISSAADEDSLHMMEQDAASVQDVDKEVEKIYPERKLKAKKRSQETVVEQPAVSRQEGRLYQAPVKAISTDVLRNGRQVMVEEGMATVMSVPIIKDESVSPVQRRQAVVVGESVAETLGLMATGKSLSKELSPADWLQNIVQLIEQGDINQAKEELDKFKKYYPDEKIEQSLLRKLTESKQ